MANQPNIKQCYAMFNKQKVVAIYDEDLQQWSIETTAPAESSWNQPDHVFTVELYAEDLAGNLAKMDSSDITYGEQLKIRVLEKTAPTATIKYPTQGSVLGDTTQTIQLVIKDEGGSGLNMASIEFKVNGEVKTVSSWSDGADGEKIASYEATDLSNGSNTVTLKVWDNDGNESNTASVTFVISTDAPSLDVTTPIDNLITNDFACTVSGVAKAGSSYTTISQVTVNGIPVSVDPETGAFTTTVTLTEGSNTIVIVATDNIGKTTTVRRNVTLDTVYPIITDVKAEATTVDASGRIRITFKVSEAQ